MFQLEGQTPKTYFLNSASQQRVLAEQAMNKLPNSSQTAKKSVPFSYKAGICSCSRGLSQNWL